MHDHDDGIFASYLMFITVLLGNWHHMGYLLRKKVCVLVQRCLQTVTAKPEVDDYLFLFTTNSIKLVSF